MKVQFLAAFAELFEPYAYKAYHGGRGGGKSQSFSEALVLQARNEKHLILCARETQKSIKESSKSYIDAAIEKYGMNDFFVSMDTEVCGKNGSRFIFAGLRDKGAGIRSYRGVTRTWVDEAHLVSAASMEALLPTVFRVKGAELWCSWNPENPKDPVDQLFRAGTPPPNSIIREVLYHHNQFFPEELGKQMEWDRNRDPDKYAHVWLGKYRQFSEARVFHNWSVREFETPEKVRFYFGADWGFSVDPTVLIRCYIVDRTLYVDQEVWAIGCEIDRTPDLFRKIPGAMRWPITADSARPETISYMQRHGFPNIKAALKGKGSVEDGIEFLKSYDIVVHPRCKHVIDELTYYKWKQDKHTTEILPELEDDKNHTIDALRYSVEGLRTNPPLKISPKLMEMARQKGLSFATRRQTFAPH